MNKLFEVVLLGNISSGKSSFFNNLIKKNKSLIFNKFKSTTSDALFFHLFSYLLLIDTPGINKKDTLSVIKEKKINELLFRANLIIFIIDSSDFFEYENLFLIKKIKKFNKKKIWIIFNKIDKFCSLPCLYKIQKLGFKSNIYFTSTIHHFGENFIYQNILKAFTLKCAKPQLFYKNESPIKCLFIGKPNAGKSSIINFLLKKSKLIVDNKPGTTINSISVKISFQYTRNLVCKIELIDTSGIYLKNKIKNTSELILNCKTNLILQNANIIFLIIDINNGFTSMEKQLYKVFINKGIPLLIIFNKFDTILKENHKNILSHKIQKIHQLLKYPYISTFSVKKSKYDHIKKLLKKGIDIFYESTKHINTYDINKIFNEHIKKNKTFSQNNKNIFKIYYALQISKHPLMIQIFCNNTKYLKKYYENYILYLLKKYLYIKYNPIFLHWKDKKNLIKQSF